MTEITTFLGAWADAERTRDIDFLDAHLTADFVGVGPLGFALPKAAWLGRHQGDDLRYDTFEFDEIDIHPVDDVAIVVARQNAVATYRGGPLPQFLRDTVVLVASGDSWRVASIHMSFIAGTPGAPPIPATATE